jgi:hypothetical protein
MLLYHDRPSRSTAASQDWLAAERTTQPPRPGAARTHGAASKYAPSIEDIITLYDVLFQMAVDNCWLTAPATPSFNKDILPILDRAIHVEWLFNFGAGPNHDLLSSGFPPTGSVLIGRHPNNDIPMYSCSKRDTTLSYCGSAAIATLNPCHRRFSGHW